MPEGRFRSRTLRRVKLRLPSGKSTTHYVRRKSGKAQCASCGDFLKGVPHVLPVKMASISRSQRRPERPYGGVLCSRCSRLVIANKVRSVFSLSK